MSIDEYSLEEYYADELGKVTSRAQASESGASLEDAYTEIVIERLENFEVLENAQSCYFNQRNLRANGFAINDDQLHVDVIVADFKKQGDMRTIGQQGAEKVAERARNFIERSLDGLHHELEITNPAFDMSKRIHDAAENLETARIIVISNAKISRAELQDVQLKGIKVTHHIWDIERMWKVDTSEKGREEIIVEFERPLACVVDDDNDEYITYLAVVPGDELADQYSKWGLRLLERNVRAYLQALGNVNKGILKTLGDEPNRFLTYNNGLSAVAEHAEIEWTGRGPVLKTITDWQIVNGGQTTASLHRARYDDGVDISRAKVQMKLTVVKDPTKAEEIIPKISQYSNTQNKVQMADLASNDEYHHELEKLSRKTITPIQDTGVVVSYWFYERIRRQYLVEKSRHKGREKREWENQHPKSQTFEKTDLANALLVWQEEPHVVAQGNQKAFAHFTGVIKETKPVADDAYYKQCVAKIILWKEMSSIARRFTGMGHIKNTQAYSLAWLHHRLGGRINLNKIWTEQGIGDLFRDQLSRISDAMHHALTHPKTPVAYLGEWHKKKECWDELRDISVPIDDAFISEYGADSLVQSGDIGSQEDAVAVIDLYPKDIWKRLMRWGIETNNLLPSEAAACSKVSIAVHRNQEPVAKHMGTALQALKKAESKGFLIDVDE